MRALLAASALAVLLLTLAPAVAADPLALPEIAVQAPSVEPALEPTPSAAYCTCDPIPIVLVVLYLLAYGPCIVDAAAYDRVHSYDLNRERNDCTIDSHPSYSCVGDSGTDVQREVGFVEATVRVCHPPLPPIAA